jgi:hypothetical protein
MTLFFLFLLKFRVKLNLVQLLIFTTLFLRRALLAINYETKMSLLTVINNQLLIKFKLNNKFIIQNKNEKMNSNKLFYYYLFLFYLKI